MRIADKVTITPALPGDATWIATLSRTLIENGIGWTWRPSRVARHILRPNSAVITARTEAFIAGFAIMRFFDDYAHLDLLAVDRPYQRLGIGRRLIEWLENTARTGGCLVVHLEVRENNLHAQAFYRALGYMELVRIPGYYQRRETAVRLFRYLRR